MLWKQDATRLSADLTSSTKTLARQHYGSETEARALRLGEEAEGRGRGEGNAMFCIAFATWK